MSVRVLAAVRDNPGVDERVRVSAARTILSSVVQLGRQPTLGEVPKDQAIALAKSELQRIIDQRADDGADQ